MSLAYGMELCVLHSFRITSIWVGLVLLVCLLLLTGITADHFSEFSWSLFWPPAWMVRLPTFREAFL